MFISTLPSVSIVDPDFRTNSEENPQDIQLGEAYAASVVNAVSPSPAQAFDSIHLACQLPGRLEGSDPAAGFLDLNSGAFRVDPMATASAASYSWLARRWLEVRTRAPITGR